MKIETEFRKISVGTGFPDKCIHYQVGKQVSLGDDPSYFISSIVTSASYKREGKTAYEIYITNNNGTLLWKTIYDMPSIVENNIDFD